ncbi:MAG TPA: PLP-dependent lyase/thiolase [Acidimicrobiales bacterium]|nr:PLP-dependent lyase/thiolase [Acidimicrobiales bacterium]
MAIEGNPFVLYRHRLWSYARWLEGGGTDRGFVDLVEELDGAVAEVDGHGFSVTPLTEQPGLAAASGLPRRSRLWVKDETSNVSGSHKARHLFGLALHTMVAERLGTGSSDEGTELAIASCGNAALAAAVIARAVDRPLRVFIPTWADAPVVESLNRLEARVQVCERRDGEQGDPCYRRFRESVAAGAVPFSVQGTDAPDTLDGGRTIGWELADQLAEVQGAPARLDTIPVQVGGGALGASLAMGLRDGVEEGRLLAMPAVHPVQTEAVHPLGRAFDLLVEEGRRTGLSGAALIEVARSNPDRFMWPWEDMGTSLASGILDDVTYDWLPLVEATLESGGHPVTVAEELVERAWRLGREKTGIDVSATGTAGLAGLMAIADSLPDDDFAVVLFTGRQRD